MITFTIWYEMTELEFDEEDGDDDYERYAAAAAMMSDDDVTMKLMSADEMKV